MPDNQLAQFQKWRESKLELAFHLKANAKQDFFFKKVSIFSEGKVFFTTYVTFMGYCVRIAELNHGLLRNMRVKAAFFKGLSPSSH